MTSKQIDRLILGLLLCFALPAFSQKENRFIRQGNKLFEEGKFTEAEKDYRKALEINKESLKGQFNLGTAVYKSKNFEESAGIYSALGDRNLGKTDKAEIFHNLGNSLLESQQYQKSIDAYKQALLNNPADKDSKYNLEYARMKLRQQQQQNKDQENKQDQKKEDKQDQQEQQQDKEQQDQQKPPPRPDKISREDAERMLEAMKNDEKKTMEKVKKQNARAVVVGIEKDW